MGVILRYLRKHDYKNMDLISLIEAAQASNLLALEEILRRQGNIVYSSLYHLSPFIDNIDDLSQEVLMRIARSIKTLKKKETFKFWMNQIISNVFYDDLRKKKRKPNAVSIDSFYDDLSDNTQKEIEDKTINIEEKLKNSELDIIIRNSIRGLEEHFREVVVLRELQGLSYEQISRIVGVNIGTVKSRIARARIKLQDKLKYYVE
jgi:RNA polymerase sigma-70 factor (ECF subfamily)